MNDPHSLIQACERLQEAAAEENISAFRQRLEELADLLAANCDTHSTLSDMHKIANNLAKRANKAEKLVSEQPGDTDPTIPDPLQQRATALTRRVCECILRTDEFNTESLTELVAEPTNNAIESFIAELDELEAHNILFAAKLRAAHEEREEAFDALEYIIEQLKHLDTDRNRLEASRQALKEAEKREREARKLADRINNKAENL